MEKLLKVGMVVVICAVLLSLALHGLPKDMVALMTPLSLMLLVFSLWLQARTQQQMREDSFLGVQVQALAALIEDDRQKLASMATTLRSTGEKDPRFSAILARYKRRLNELNRLTGQRLHLPEQAVVEAD